MSDRADRRRRTVVGALLAFHVALYATMLVTGRAAPFEKFDVLLLVANAVTASLLVKRGGDLLIGAGMMFLIAVHGFVGRSLAPDPLTSGAVLLVSLLVVYVAVNIYTKMPARYWWAFVASYFALFALFVWSPFAVLRPIANAEPLFILFLLGLVACVRDMRLLAFFWALTLSFTVCQPYAWETAIISCFALTALFSARGRVPSPTATVFLTCGLALVFMVLLPVVVIALGESPRNIALVLDQPAVRSALATTLITATVSTAFLVLLAVPLAYALARLRFRGKSVLLSLIDLPIVIPQSVAGIALVRLFGDRQILGELARDYLGVTFEGRWLGVCLAQVFVAMPFLVKSAVAAFEAVPERLELAARTLGASSWGAFRRVALPLAARGVFLGAVLAWARAAGEFGALVFIAETPRTAPVLVRDWHSTRGLYETQPLAATLLLFSLVMFFLLQFVARALPGGRREEDMPA